MFFLSVKTVLLLALIAVGQCQDNILQNPGFEDPLDGSDWYCVGCTLTQDTDAYVGQFSGRATQRQAYWATISQDAPLESNMRYHFTAYVKLAEMNDGAMWHQVDTLVELVLADGSSDYVGFGKTPYLRLDQGWQKVGGDFYVDGREITRFRVYVQVNQDGENPVAYLVDEASLVPVPGNPNWKEEANQRIDEIRKNEVTVNFNAGSYDPSTLEVKVAQTRQSFPFGSAIVDGQIAGDSDYNNRYQDTYYSHFNWAVMENALKWQAMEPEREQIYYPDESIRRLNERGVPLRGHAVFWGVDQFVPYWLKSMTGEQVLSEIQRRIDYVVPRYDGQLVHWDVNNEVEHGAWFELATGQPTILNDMFSDVRARDEDVVLFLNDYNIVSGSIALQSFLNKAVEVDTATGLVGGLGAQGHFQNYPDVNGIQHDLDMVATSGYPLWITELDIELEDREQRADAYDDVVTAMYAHPGVAGILLWGFSDRHHWRPNCALFEGEFFEPNAAGLRWQEMMFTRWRSYYDYFPPSAEGSFGFRGFHGSYSIQVLESGVQVHNQTFELPVGQDTTVDVQL